MLMSNQAVIGSISMDDMDLMVIQITQLLKLIPGPNAAFSVAI